MILTIKMTFSNSKADAKKDRI